jgi:hypothetical protein
MFTRVLLVLKVISLVIWVSVQVEVWWIQIILIGPAMRKKLPASRWLFARIQPLVSSRAIKSTGIWQECKRMRSIWSNQWNVRSEKKWKWPQNRRRIFGLLKAGDN